MLLRVVDDGIFRDIEIKEGHMFLLPGALRTCSTAFLILIIRWQSTCIIIMHTRYVCVVIFLPGNTPHNPVRFADTVGIVIERVRPETSIGMWSCEIRPWGGVLI
jgi:3-hydroxyanthranilate 3,4-dioxygenase